LITENEKDELSVFATCPSIRNFTTNFLSEVLATFIFMFLNFSLTEGFIFFMKKKYSIAFPLSLIVLGIGLSLGGTTRSVINPACDLGPRIIYSLIPIPGKGKSNWDYAWIPVLGPVIGSSIVSVLYLLFSTK
jgi:glycerol uptake facilitator protein